MVTKADPRKAIAAPAPGDGRAWLKAKLGAWPEIDEKMADFLSQLPWRVRWCVVLNYGCDMKQYEIAEKLNISRRTVQEDVSYATRLAESWQSNAEDEGAMQLEIRQSEPDAFYRDGFTAGYRAAIAHLWLHCRTLPVERGYWLLLRHWRNNVLPWRDALGEDYYPPPFDADKTA